MYIQLLFCPIRVKAQGLSFFPFVQFNISALGYLYYCIAFCINIQEKWPSSPKVNAYGYHGFLSTTPWLIEIEGLL